MLPFKNNPRREGQPSKSPFRALRGQNITEYMILVVGVLTVVILATRPGGFFTQGVNRALNLMFSGVDRIATETCSSTIDDRDGGWTNWSTLTDCVDCTRTQTRTCTNPEPGCNGKLCVFEDGVTTGLLETRSFECSSGSWVPGTCGETVETCTGAGNCGSTDGSCTQSVDCIDPFTGLSSVCCAGTKPSTTIWCRKKAYPDVWSALGNWSPCSVICGTGTQTQTVTCSGTCCDNAPFDPVSRPGGKPPVTRPCVAGCCAAELVIGTDGAGNPFTGSFPDTPDGGTASAGCPAGYIGFPADPKSLCTGTTFGPVINQCVPAVGSCPAWTTDIGSGVSGTFQATKDGDPASADCAVFDSRYQGISTAECSMGTWQNLAQNCQPAGCAEEIFKDPNNVLQGTFNSGAHGTSRTLDCGTIDNQYAGTFSRTCDYGRWTNPTGGCSPSSGCLEKILDGSDFASGTLPASPEGTEITVPCDPGCAGPGILWRCANTVWTKVGGSCVPPNCPTEDNVDIGAGVLGCFWESPSAPATNVSPRKAGCQKWTQATCGLGYLGGPYKNCVSGTWSTVQNPCVQCTGTCSGGGQCGEYRALSSCTSPYTSGSYYYRCAGNDPAAPTWIYQYNTCTMPPACTDPTCAPTECGTTTKTKCDGSLLKCGDCCTGGTTPPGGTWSWCSGDSQAGTGNTKISIVTVNKGSCTNSQCEKECNTGYVADGTTCNWCTCPAPQAKLYPDATVGPGDGTDNCGDQRTVTCKSDYTGTPTKITCGSITQTWTGDGPVCAPACVPTTCADLSLCSGACNRTSYSDDCTGTISCGPCPQWVNASRWGTQCNVVCASVGMCSTSDPWGKNCRSDETCGHDGSCVPLSGVCTNGEGGISGNTSTCSHLCPNDTYINPCLKEGGSGTYDNCPGITITVYDCRDSGQKRDCDITDFVAACYCY